MRRQVTPTNFIAGPLRVMPAAVNHASQAVIFQDYHSIKRKIAGLTAEFKKKKCSGKGLK